MSLLDAARSASGLGGFPIREDRKDYGICLEAMKMDGLDGWIGVETAIDVVVATRPSRTREI
jgi:hypothetical protein